MPSVRRVQDYDTVLILMGWDKDGNLRITEDGEWEPDFDWKGEPRLICLHVPITARPKKRQPLHLWLDLLSSNPEVRATVESK
jgi:hypothetical protein